jgi:hypothetical protein
VSAYETAIQQWRTGERRLAAAAPAEQRVMQRVVDAIVIELRRRLGGAFTADELAELYDRGTAWCLDVAVSVAPEDPYAWEADTVADAAFALYLRGATDYAGGRRLA